jgi:hypothetical protein
MPTIEAGNNMVFFTSTIGFFMLIIFFDLWKRRRKIAWIKMHGTFIETDFLEVYCESENEPDLKNPRCYIISTWKDPNTEKIYTFESTGFNIKPEVKVKKISVLVDPKDIAHYYTMDLSFLDES